MCGFAAEGDNLHARRVFGLNGRRKVIRPMLVPRNFALPQFHVIRTPDLKARAAQENPNWGCDQIQGGLGQPQTHELPLVFRSRATLGESCLFHQKPQASCGWLAVRLTHL